MSDLFSSADLYTCDKDAEEFDAETPEDAIAQYEGARDGQPLIVYGHKRKTVDDEWIAAEGTDLADRLLEDFDDEFGGDNTSSDFAELFTEAVKSAVEDLTPYRCDPCGQREYSAEEVAQIRGRK